MCIAKSQQLQEETTLRNFFIFFLLLLFVSGCVNLDFLKQTKKEEVGLGTAFTGIIGGKGVQVGFVPNNPPLDKIDGPFGLAIKFFNFNVEPMTIDSFTVGSTGVYEGFTNFADESLTLEGALIRETERGPIFLAPGTEFTYTGQANKQRDGSLHYGDFSFSNIDAGAGTAFYVDMIINDYLSNAYFQFCAFDLGATLPLGNCPTTQTLTGNQLGFGFNYDPVAVTTITRTLSSTKDSVRITLDILIQDRSEKQSKPSSGKAFERGQIIPDNGQEQFFFEMEPTTGKAITFSCTSSQERSAAGKSSTFLMLVLQNGKAQVRCTGYDSLFEERKDYQYHIQLRYPYLQTISTSYIPLRKDIKQTFS